MIKNIGLLGIVTGVFTLVTGCFDNRKERRLEFSLTKNAQLISCNSFIDKDYQIAQLWFYMSSLRAKTEDGWQPVLLGDNQWQTHNLALVGMHCSDNKSNNWQVVLKDALPRKASAIAFDIAIPFELNHQNPLIAEGIFDNANMFWTWRQGYKSLRFDLESASAGGWAYHLGALGCNSASAIRAPQSPCRQPNHMEIVLEHYDVNLPIKIDVARIIKDIKLETASRCLSMPTQASCDVLNSNMKNLNSPVFSQ